VTTLKRHLNLWRLTAYGVGDIVGAGIYVLVGKLAAEAGGVAWLSFVLSWVVILPTALSYCELTSRYPKSGGVAVFVGRAFQDPRLTFLIGFFVLLSGLVSAATSANGFHGYLTLFLTLPPWLAIVIFLAFISFINFWGIDTSSRLNIICLIAEIGGLLLIIGAGAFHWPRGEFFVGKGPAFFSPATLDGIASASVLAFFATIGFEDLCNVSEEVKNPERTLPRAILLCLTISSLIYVGIALTVVSVASAQELGASQAPLAMVAAKILPFFTDKAVALLAIFSVTNTALANMIMGSRLLYGMSREGWIYPSLSLIHPERQTPWVAILATFGITLTLALTGGVKALGQTTSTIMLILFVTANLSLLVIRVKKRRPDSAEGRFQVPLAVPLLGILLSLFLLTQAPAGVFLRVGILFAVGVGFYGIYRLTGLLRNAFPS
jgi:amino acid transporter